MDLKNKVAIVTGARRGMGRAHALVLAQAGAKVVVSDIALADCEKVVKEIEKAKGAEELEKDIYTLSQTMKLDAKDAFGAIYLTLIGKNHGPKAAWLIMGIGKKKVINRLKEL